MALSFQVPKLRHAEVEIMILAKSAMSQAKAQSFCHTHTHTCNIGSDFVQERHHMSALGDSAFKAWVEGISGEEG